MTDELGKAELELGADLAPLDADLREAGFNFVELEGFDDGDDEFHESGELVG